MARVSSDPDRPSPAPGRAGGAGFVMGLLLALTTSGGIAGERVTRGSFVVAFVANALATGAALLAVAFTMRRMRSSHRSLLGSLDARASRLAILVPQASGAVVGIVAVHFLLRREALGALPWLSERPAQFVNDAVAVAGFLALVWAVTDGLDTRLLALAFAGVTLYRVTAPLWHLDHAPGGFQTSVQELVVAQFVGAALAVGLFRTAVARADR